MAFKVAAVVRATKFRTSRLLICFAALAAADNKCLHQTLTKLRDAHAMSEEESGCASGGGRQCGSILAFERQHERYTEIARTHAARGGGVQVCETGVFHGQSAAVWLCADPEVRYLGFDLVVKPPVRTVLEEVFRDRVTLVEGDSRTSLPSFRAAHPALACDIISVDGGHFDEAPTHELRAFSHFSRPGTTLIVDEVGFEEFHSESPARGVRPCCPNTTMAWNAAVQTGLVRQRVCVSGRYSKGEEQAIPTAARWRVPSVHQDHAGQGRGWCEGEFLKAWPEMPADDGRAAPDDAKWRVAEVAASLSSATAAAWSNTKLRTQQFRAFREAHDRARCERRGGEVDVEAHSPAGVAARRRYTLANVMCVDMQSGWVFFKLMGLPDALPAGTLLRWHGWAIAPPRDAPGGRFIKAYFAGSLSSLSADGGPTNPPLYVHHIHVKSGRNGLDFQVHGDTECVPAEGGGACFLFHAPGSLAWVRREQYRGDGAFVVTANASKRIAPLVAFRFAVVSPLAPIVPIALFNFANPGQVPPFSTFPLPKNGLHAHWFTTEMPASGWAVHHFFHTHERVFRNVWVFANRPSELGLNEPPFAYERDRLLRLRGDGQLAEFVARITLAPHARQLCAIDERRLLQSAESSAGANLQLTNDIARRAVVDRHTALTCTHGWVFEKGDPITVVAAYEAGSLFRQTAEWELGSTRALASPAQFQRPDIFLQHMGLRTFVAWHEFQSPSWPPAHARRKDFSDEQLRVAGRAVCPVTSTGDVPHRNATTTAETHRGLTNIGSDGTWVTCG